MRHNKTKAMLKAGETVFGCFINYTEPSLVEIVGYQKWDFVVFDGEHSPLEPRDVMNLVRAAELRDVTPIARVPTNHQATILRFLDTGAQGVQVPWVNSGPEAKQVVNSVKYRPDGNRGLAGVRSADYGQSQPYRDYVRQSNAETLVIAQIEGVEAVNNIEEIAAIEGIDVLFIGPTDLSNSFGHPGESDHPEVQAAIERVVSAAKGTDKALGMMVRDAEGARRWRSRGFRYITIGLETILRPAMAAYLEGARK